MYDVLRQNTKRYYVLLNNDSIHPNLTNIHLLARKRTLKEKGRGIFVPKLEGAHLLMVDAER